MISYDRELRLSVFFILKTLKNRIWAREVFLFRVDFKFWGGFVCFSEPWIGLTKYIECFLGVLGQRWVQNNFLDEKNKGPCFSSHHSAQIMRMNRWRVLCSIKLKKIYRPACLGLFLLAIVGLLLDWARQWPNLLGLAVSDPIFLKK